MTMQSPDEHEFNVRLLAVVEEGKWVVLCVDYMLASVADSLDEARESFSRIFAAHLHQDLREGLKPLSTVPRRQESDVEQRFSKAPLVGNSTGSASGDVRFLQELRFAG